MPRMNGTPIISPRGPEPVGAYPHARRVGDFLFVSGIGPRKRGQKEIPGTTLDAHGNAITYDVTVECKQVFENIRVIIEDAGAKWENIVDVTSFLTDMKRDFAAYNKAYEEAFGHVKPTRTTVEVKSLPTAIHVELKVIAWVGSH